MKTLAEYLELLAGAQMPVSDGREFEVFGESFHRSTCSSSFLRGGPRMRLARFEESEDGHQERESGEGAVADDGHAGELLRCTEAAAIDVHVQEIRPSHSGQEPHHDRPDARGPDSQTPATQHYHPHHCSPEWQR